MATATLTVRPVRMADLDAIAELEKAAFQDFWPAEMLACEIEHPRAILLLALRDGRPVGYAAFRHAADEAELLRLAVRPEERRRGVAGALVTEGLKRLQDEDVQVCFLEVRQDNAPAIALYQRLGFARNGRRRGYYRDGTDALIYVLEL
jgi:ribosomal-protein-alanine N-acetyltransferase